MAISWKNADSCFVYTVLDRFMLFKNLFDIFIWVLKLLVNTLARLFGVNWQEKEKRGVSQILFIVDMK